MRPGVFRIDGTGANATHGKAVWAPSKSLWFNAHLLVALTLGPLYFSFNGLFVCLGLTYVTLLLGHSVGLHRRLIHRTFRTNVWMDGILVYRVVVVGLAGTRGGRSGIQPSRLGLAEDGRMLA